ncbi:MAG TPA: hypothetical protein VGB37_06385 [Candidatus Lokiarchaeia archaeon]
MTYILNLFSLIFAAISFIFFALSLRDRKDLKKFKEKSIVGLVFFLLQFLLILLATKCGR